LYLNLAKDSFKDKETSQLRKVESKGYPNYIMLK